MKKIGAILLMCLLLAASLWMVFNEDDSESKEEHISAIFKYKIDGYDVHVNATYSEGTDLTYTWDWGDGTASAQGNQTDNSTNMPVLKHSYPPKIESYIISLIVNDTRSNALISLQIHLPDYEIGVCPEDVNIALIDNLTNKWAILCSICNENYTEWGIEADYQPAIDTLLGLGYPEEHFVRLENWTFTKMCMIEALEYVKKASSDFKEATVVFYIVTHGGAQPDVDGKYHSFIEIYEDGAESIHTEDNNGDTTTMWDYELAEILADFFPTKFLFITVACESGNMANEDTTGQMHGAADPLFDSVGAPGRIVVAGSTAPLMTSGSVIGEGFWQKGIGENRGDETETGNQDGESSVEEAFYYCKTMANAEGTLTGDSQPCMDDRYPEEDPGDGEMLL